MFHFYYYTVSMKQGKSRRERNLYFYAFSFQRIINFVLTLSTMYREVSLRFNFRERCARQSWKQSSSILPHSPSNDEIAHWIVNENYALRFISTTPNPFRWNIFINSVSRLQRCLQIPFARGHLTQETKCVENANHGNANARRRQS